MFAGHIGAAMAIARADRRVNVGVFVFAGVLLDVVLWPLVLLGWESATIPANFRVTYQAEFVFPLSHGLLTSIAWSVLAGMTMAHHRLRLATWPRVHGSPLSWSALWPAGSAGTRTKLRTDSRIGCSPMPRPSPAQRPAARPPRRSLRLGHWSLVITVLILALMQLPYLQRW